MIAEPPRSFPLAPMSPLIVMLTAVVLALPVIFIVAGLLSPVRSVLWGAAAFIVALCAAVWLFARPSRFEVSADGLAVVWPLRRRFIPRARIGAVRLVDRSDLRRELGWGARVGVGGLWGQFGWAWTTRRGWVDTYISRLDGLVWIERGASRPLLITPANPEGFVRALGIAGDSPGR